tara:strand:+ start:798 stop:1376 length:579 start_codon:yes stop_codon:yes gene_type:complete
MVYNILGKKFIRLYARRMGSIMDILFIVIIAGLSFITGAISITVFKSFNQVSTNESEEISKKLQKSDLELKEYQQAVSEHFLVLSQLVTNVINGYKDINEHLTKSALRLSSPEIGKQLLKNNNTKLADLEAVHQKIDLSNIDIPRDYAPKVPGGVLSEGYSVKQEDKSDADELPSSVPAKVEQKKRKEKKSN